MTDLQEELDRRARIEAEVWGIPLVIAYKRVARRMELERHEPEMVER